MLVVMNWNKVSSPCFLFVSLKILDFDFVGTRTGTYRYTSTVPGSVCSSYVSCLLACFLVSHFGGHSVRHLTREPGLPVYLAVWIAPATGMCINARTSRHEERREMDRDDRDTVGHDAGLGCEHCKWYSLLSQHTNTCYQHIVHCCIQTHLGEYYTIEIKDSVDFVFFAGRTNDKRHEWGWQATCTKGAISRQSSV